MADDTNTTEVAPAAGGVPATEGARFHRLTMASAGKLLDQWVGAERAAEAKGRIASAFQAAAMAARNPSDFYASTPASVAHCVAISALTGMMPSTGAASLAYLVPRRPRKGEAPQLNYQLSHRGLAALARRAGLVLIALPCGVEDRLDITDGEVTRFEPQVDNPPLTWEELRGIVIVVKNSDGQVLFRGWVAKRLIEIRRNSSDSFTFAEKNDWAKRTDPWHAWAVEMSMKTAMHYAVSRGWAVIDDTEAVRALAYDSSGDAKDDDGPVVTVTRTVESVDDIIADQATSKPAADEPAQIAEQQRAAEPTVTQAAEEQSPGESAAEPEPQPAAKAERKAPTGKLFE